MYLIICRLTVISQYMVARSRLMNCQRQGNNAGGGADTLKCMSERFSIQDNMVQHCRTLQQCAVSKLA